MSGSNKAIDWDDSPLSRKQKGKGKSKNRQNPFVPEKPPSRTTVVERER